MQCNHIDDTRLKLACRLKINNQHTHFACNHLSQTLSGRLAKTDEDSVGVGYLIFLIPLIVGSGLTMLALADQDTQITLSPDSLNIQMV